MASEEDPGSTSSYQQEQDPRSRSASGNVAGSPGNSFGKSSGSRTGSGIYNREFTGLNIKDLDLVSKVKRPQWIDDAQCSACSKCASQFSAFNRRHHCRQCGLLYCGSCSAKKIALPELEYHKPVRACDCCYAITIIKNTLNAKEPNYELKVVKDMAELAADSMRMLLCWLKLCRN